MIFFGILRVDWWEMQSNDLNKNTIAPLTYFYKGYAKLLLYTDHSQKNSFQQYNTYVLGNKNMEKTFKKCKWYFSLLQKTSNISEKIKNFLLLIVEFE